jgi:enamine deaminase RidA (YjgF/YER057c/UK114 family)
VYEQVRDGAGRIDVLFANAGGSSLLPLGAITEEQYEHTSGRDVKGVLFTVQKALPPLGRGASGIFIRRGSGCMHAKGLRKKLFQHGVPWESAYGYQQAVQVGDTIFISGQLSHDDVGNLIGPAPVDASGRITDVSNMELQMRTAYGNAAKVLAFFGATFENVVEEVVSTIDIDAAFAVARRVRRDVFGTEMPECASTLLGTTRLAFPQQLVEISLTAILPVEPSDRGVR